MKNKKNRTTLDQILDNKYGKRGAEKREEWEQEFEIYAEPGKNNSAILVQELVP